VEFLELNLENLWWCLYFCRWSYWRALGNMSLCT